MSTIAADDDSAGGAPIPLRFEITADEVFAWTKQLARGRRNVWMVLLTRVAAVGMACLAVHFTLERNWIMAVLTAWLAVSTWSQHLIWVWLMRTLFRNMTIHADLEVDSTGVRGEFKYRSGRSWGNDQRRVSCSWNRLRKVERLPDHLLFEFHGGSGAIIPVRAFASRVDLDQCAAWAEHGLAQQRQRAA